MVPDLQPKVPGNLPPLGGELLKALGGLPEAAEFVLGGGVALGHYVDYRPTHDLDAWWLVGPHETAWQTVVKIMLDLAARHGLAFDERGWGTTRSGSQKRFSFQVSRRDLGLDQPFPSHWPPLWIETFRDNLASKMNALVGRGLRAISRTLPRSAGADSSRPPTAGGSGSSRTRRANWSPPSARS